jgi:bifunctional N-acetylglucosamine-1-phosphate-uridyltransferase/glucosamine-1-phosphate-acetyltransferase GlmU-like protein
MIVIILAGGEGKRMNSALPKVCHMVRSREVVPPEPGQWYPMIQLLLLTVAKLNPEKVLIVVGKHKDTIKNCIQSELNIEYIMQDVPQGTGHAIMCCLDKLSANTDTLILSGDVPFISVQTLQRLESNTILVTNLNNPHGYGRIITENGLVTRIVEQKDCTPEEGQIQMVNCGIYNLNSDYLRANIPLLSNNNNAREYYLTDIIHGVKPIVLEPEHLKEIQNINTQRDLQLANAKYGIGTRFIHNECNTLVREILYVSIDNNQVKYTLNNNNPSYPPIQMFEHELDMYYTKI